MKNNVLKGIGLTILTAMVLPVIAWAIDLGVRVAKVEVIQIEREKVLIDIKQRVDDTGKDVKMILQKIGE